MYRVTPERLQAIKDCWDPNYSASALAEAVSKKLGSEVTKGVIIGLYHRNPQLRITHPLAGRRYVRDAKGKLKPAGRGAGYRAPRRRK